MHKTQTVVLGVMLSPFDLLIDIVSKKQICSQRIKLSFVQETIGSNIGPPEVLGIKDATDVFSMSSSKVAMLIVSIIHYVR